MGRRTGSVWPLIALAAGVVGLGVWAAEVDKPPGRRLKALELARLAYGAGWRGEDLVQAVAVALAESGGITDQVGTNHHKDGSVTYDRGLWQINSRDFPELWNPFDALANAVCAFKIWRKFGWVRWVSTWESKGAPYKKHMAAAQAAVNQLRAA